MTLRSLTLSIISSLFLILFSVPAFAIVRLPALLADHMVLQQQSDVKIWGTAGEGSKVTVKPSWTAGSYTTGASKSDGSWAVSIPTPAATTIPQSIAVSDADGEIKINDILIGEVWYCSGQSNMEMPMRGYNHQPVDGGLDAILSARPDTPIRMFTVGKGVSSVPLDTCEGHWGTHTPEEVAECSATAYYFADFLSKSLDGTPVGVIISVWGGTTVQPWLSKDTAAEAGLDLSGTDTPVDRRTPDVLLMPSVLYNSMAAPVLPYTIKGMLWYQGESNCPAPTEYERLMPRYVQCMRDGFGREDLPFYYVQIAPYGGYTEPADSVATLRLAQSRLMDQVDNTGMVVTLDIGNRLCIHPRDKQSVGKRLAYWALAKDYGKNPYAWSGPIYDHMISEGKRALIYFSNTGGGVSPLEEELSGFEAAGTDGIYRPARAIVECATGTLTVYCDEVDTIKKVRYAHAPYAEASLFDNFGLPASPFIATLEDE